MYICDGSVVAANLGVNPSLTITALAERAMSFIQPASQTKWNDAAETRSPSAVSVEGAKGGAMRS
jgi:cholesterol oxidase